MLLNLPAEIISIEIITRLAPTDLARLARTCQVLSAAARQEFISRVGERNQKLLAEVKAIEYGRRIKITTLEVISFWYTITDRRCIVPAAIGLLIILYHSLPLAELYCSKKGLFTSDRGVQLTVLADIAFLWINAGLVECALFIPRSCRYSRRMNSEIYSGEELSKILGPASNGIARQSYHLPKLLWTTIAGVRLRQLINTAELMPAIYRDHVYDYARECGKDNEINHTPTLFANHWLRRLAYLHDPAGYYGLHYNLTKLFHPLVCQVDGSPDLPIPKLPADECRVAID